MSTLQVNASSTGNPFTLKLAAQDDTQTQPTPCPAVRPVREPFRLPFAIPGAPAPKPTRAIRTGSEPGRANLQARRETPALAAKHSQLIRSYLAEPAGDFDRCLSIALDRMIDAIEAGIDANADARL